MITKLINRLIIVTILSSVNLIAYGEIINLKDEYYEKDSCIYIVGHLTREEKLAEQKHYKKRMAERTRQLEIESQQRHEIEIENIRAQAMRDYLIAQGVPLREVADALKKIKSNQSINIGNILSKSTSSTGKITNSLSSTNRNTNTNKN